MHTMDAMQWDLFNDNSVQRNPYNEILATIRLACYGGADTRDGNILHRLPIDSPQPLFHPTFNIVWWRGNVFGVVGSMV